MTFIKPFSKAAQDELANGASFFQQAMRLAQIRGIDLAEIAAEAAALSNLSSAAPEFRL